jgi:hypothetical protein
MTTIRIDDTNLTIRGLPRDTLAQRPFNLSDYTVTIDSQTEGFKKRRVLKQTQIATYSQILEAPFSAPYIYVISSDPNDARAKQCAAHLMQMATRLQLSGVTSKQTVGRQTPLWHQVNGSYKDRLRDGADDQPSMLILSGITNDCTPVKLEKVRDLLEQFNHVPRIVVITGEDPISWANTRLKLSIQHALDLATNRSTSL